MNVAETYVINLHFVLLLPHFFTQFVYAMQNVETLYM